MAVKWARARRASRVRRSSSAPFHAGSAARTHKSESACQPVRPTTARGADAPNRGRSDRSHSPDPPTDEPGRAISVLGVSVARRIRRPFPGRLHASTAWECHEFGPEISGPCEGGIARGPVADQGACPGAASCWWPVDTHARATHGGSTARRAIEFADAVADRPGESVSRANMQCSGISRPQLQVALAGASGLVYIVDFWWPEFDMIGEFDGNREYTDPAFLRGHAAIHQP